MSNEWLNIRFGMCHLQAEGLKFKLVRNPYHMGYPNGIFAIYKIWPFK